MNIIIGQFGPGSAQIGGLIMLPQEARAFMRELAGKIVELKDRGYYCYFRINHANFFGSDEYGQVVASLVKVSHIRGHGAYENAPFVPNWTPLQG